MFFYIAMICIRKEKKKTMLLLNNPVFKKYNQI